MSDLGTRVRDGLETLGRTSASDPRPVVAVVLVLIVLSGGIAATSLQMSMGMTLYIDDDSETAEEWAALKDDFETGNNVFVVVESDQLYDPETIRAIDRLDRRYTALDETNRVISLADLVRAGNDGEIPATETGVRRALDRATATNPEMAGLRAQVVPEAGTTIILADYGDVDTFDRGRLLPERGSDIVYRQVQEETALAALPPGLSVTITGQPVFENAAFGLMLPEMITLFAGAFALIFGVVYLVMRSKVERGWHVFLPLGTAMTALIYMMGAMGVLGYNFNAIMLGVMPIALGLGIDYGLQIQTRYLEERASDRSPVEAAGLATRTTGRALLIAMGTTVVGLGSLLVSQVPPVQQFGVTSAVSVFASMVLSVTLLPALLVRFDAGAGADASGESDEDRLEALTGLLTRRVTAGKPLVTLLIAFLLVSGGAYAYPQVEPRQQMMDFWPQNLDAKEDLERLEDTVEGSKVIYVVVETDQAYTPETFREVATYQRLMLENPNVNAVSSPVTAVGMQNGGSIPETQYALDASLRAARDDGPTAIRDPSEHPSKLLLTFYVDDVEGEPVRTLIDEFEGNADYTLTTADEVRVTGKPVLNRNVIENVTAGLTPMTLLSFALGFGFLAIAFRSVKISAVLIAAVAGSAALLVTGAMYLVGIPWNPLTITMSSLTLGIGIDYGVHVFERFEYEVAERGQSRLDAATTAVAKLSRPVIGSSFTTIFGFGVLTVSQFPVLANFGVTTVFAIALSLIAAFGILPAALVTVRLIERHESTPTADVAGS
ncbi:RND family transporter [Haloplanus rubicundus]|uniref:RND family transporter n=1 Tax=Haloplanus rubicundus TaxID=1547898 RepID=A0A345E509_9EURY|nr:hydrophobe/amphiphile efflux-3 (HAE3) family transporter [Haloplanus rubicundus]AXG07281.1 RND family transporter [Haloplanus rubicundus]